MNLQDTSLHETIQKACDDILHFLDDMLASNSAVERNVQDDLVTLADLRKPVSLNRLFTSYVELFPTFLSAHFILIDIFPIPQGVPPHRLSSRCPW